MRVLRENAPDGCVGGGLIREYLMDKAISDEFVRHLSSYGESNPSNSNAISMFSVDIPGYMIVKGIVGKDTLRVVFRPGKKEEASGLLKSILGDFRN
jgi:hypothetical protein